MRFRLVGEGGEGGRWRSGCRERADERTPFPLEVEEEFGDLLAAGDVALITLELGNGKGLGVPSKLYSTLASGRPAIAILGGAVGGVSGVGGRAVRTASRDHGASERLGRR